MKNQKKVTYTQSRFVLIVDSLMFALYVRDSLRMRKNTIAIAVLIAVRFVIGSQSIPIRDRGLIMTKEQECLIKAVEQTVKQYANFEGSRCGFCKKYSLGNYYNPPVVCKKCPIYKLEGGHCVNKKNGQQTKLGVVRDDATWGNIPSCLAIMVYVWGFINFGINFKEKL